MIGRWLMIEIINFLVAMLIILILIDRLDQIKRI